MNINDIILRDLMDADRAEKKERESAAKNNAVGDECASAWIAVSVWIALGIFALITAFLAGIEFQTRRDLKAQREHQAWYDKTRREAEARARAMTNNELLKVTATNENAEAVK